MAFCPNCGSPVNDDAKFCSNCSYPLNQINRGLNTGPRERREGFVYKCPKCGESINAFSAVCPSCGHEFRGSQSSESLYAFVQAITNAESDGKKVDIIRTFPIPNTKEDIIEFMLIASTNMAGEQKQSVYDAWLVKFDQGYQKARLLIRDSKEFEEVQRIYDLTQKKVKTTRVAKATLPILPQLIVAVAWTVVLLILIFLSTLDWRLVDTDMVNSFFLILMLVGIFAIPPLVRGESKTPKIIVTAGIVGSLLILLLISTLSKGYHDEQTSLFLIELIAGSIIMALMFRKKKSKKE